MKQSVLDALHGIQLWGIVRSDTGGRCGRNDEFLAAFKRLEEEVSNVEEENAKLRELVCDIHEVAHRRTAYGWVAVEEAMRELGIEVDDE